MSTKTAQAPVSLSQIESAIKKHATERKFKERVRKILRAHEDRLVIETPIHLEEAEVHSIVDSLGLTNQKSLEVEQTIDPSLLTGLIIKFKNHYFDFSLRGSLSGIAESLHM